MEARPLAPSTRSSEVRSDLWPLPEVVRMEKTGTPGPQVFMFRSDIFQFFIRAYGQGALPPSLMTTGSAMVNDQVQGMFSPGSPIPWSWWMCDAFEAVFRGGGVVWGECAPGWRVRARETRWHHVVIS
jgi:hypothetical protein